MKLAQLAVPARREKSGHSASRYSGHAMPTDLPPASGTWSPVVLTLLWAPTASPYPSCSCDSSTCEAHTVCCARHRARHIRHADVAHSQDAPTAAVCLLGACLRPWQPRQQADELRLGPVHARSSVSKAVSRRAACAAAQTFSKPPLAPESSSPPKLVRLHAWPVSELPSQKGECGACAPFARLPRSACEPRNHIQHVDGVVVRRAWPRRWQLADYRLTSVDARCSSRWR